MSALAAALAEDEAASGYFGALEADEEYNARQRRLIALAQEEWGGVWLGTVNRFHGLTRWDGGLVYNFGADFALPTPAPDVARLLKEREAAEWTAAGDWARIEAIHAAITAAGGFFLLWT